MVFVGARGEEKPPKAMNQHLSDGIWDWIRVQSPYPTRRGDFDGADLLGTDKLLHFQRLEE